MSSNLENIIPIIASCDFYIGNDSGPLHISANLNLKCLNKTAIIFF